MHRDFRNLLEKATGESEFVIVVNIDIRGFTPFSKTVESPEVAMFIKRIYMKVIDHYFPAASFFKPTGDGLIVIVPYDEETLGEKVSAVMSSCLKLLEEFPTLCADEPMINFDVPRKIGIGVSRGTACRLASGDKTLDYSGRFLNLASRLMDLARPSGIVADGNLGMSFLSDELRKLFNSDKVYVRGIAERQAIEIHYTKDYTQISASDRRPIEDTRWRTTSHSETLARLKQFSVFHLVLPSKPLDPSQMQLRALFPKALKGKQMKDVVSVLQLVPGEDFEFHLQAGKPTVRLIYEKIVPRLESFGVKSTWKVTIEISYPED